jgi:YbgC/YbaW family acyl-CoA thioester hydrolase
MSSPQSQGAALGLSKTAFQACRNADRNLQETDMCPSAAPPRIFPRKFFPAKLLSGMAYEFKAVRRVEFSETDMAGIMHFSNFFRFMETAEHGFFRSLGFSVAMDKTDPPVGWPRVHAKCDFKAPLRFEDEVEIHLLVVEKKSKALSYLFRFRKLNATPPVEVARGMVTVVCVRHNPDGSMSACHIPPHVADKIEVAPPDALK